MTTDASEQRLVHLICAAMTVGRVSLRQRRWEIHTLRARH